MRVRKAAAGGGGWSPVISVAVAIVVLLGWLTWYALGHRPVTRDGSATWSPDGTQILFDAEPNGRRDIFLMNADGTNVRPVANSEHDDEAAPSWSPDGSLVAYEAEIDGNRDIYTMSPTGSRKQRLTSGPAVDQSPSWSPNGKQIVFASDRDSKPSFDLYAMNADGTDVQRLTTSGNNGAPRFSPDGTRIAFHSGRDVFVLDLATRKLSRLTVETQSGDGMRPTWSPTGARLAFMTARRGRMEIWTMSADGSNQQPLLQMPTGSAIGPQWSPKHEELLFIHTSDVAPPLDRAPSGERAIYVLDIGSGKVTRLSR